MAKKVIEEEKSSGMTMKVVTAKKLKWVTVAEFARTKGIKAQAVYYAMDHGLIDFTKPGGREKFVVMTKTTKQYTPNSHPARPERVLEK